MDYQILKTILLSEHHQGHLSTFAIASRALAFIRGRAFVIPEDVKEISKDVLHTE